MPPANLTQALQTAFTPPDELNELLKRLSESKPETEVDYQLEERFEVIRDALSSCGEEIETTLRADGRNLSDLAEVIETTWLLADVPNAGTELKVRAAEALGAWSTRVCESREVILLRGNSGRFEHRMWSARAVAGARWPDRKSLLEMFQNDPYQDADGFFPVREAAGYHD